MSEVHLSAIADHAARVNHIIDWKGVKFLMRDTDLTARGVKEADDIRKTGAHSMNRDERCHQLPMLYSKLLVKNISPFVTSPFTNGAVHQQCDADRLS